MTSYVQSLVFFVALLVGFALLFGLFAFGTWRRRRAEDKVMKGYFLLGLSGLMSKIAMADGTVTLDETAMANRFFERMDLTLAEKAMCIGNFLTARQDGLTARDHAKRFIAYANSAACEFLYDLLWRISRADGTVDPTEDKLLEEIASYLGLGKAIYENHKAGRKPRHDKATLKAAGVPPSLLALAV